MKIWKIIFWALVAIVIALAIASISMKLRKAGAIETLITNISSSTTEHFAWDDVNGWWDFYSADAVIVKSTRLEGYAQSNIGDMSLDCATTANGNVCLSQSNYGICNGPGPHNTDGTCPNGDANGILTGWAWNDQIGWISFNCDQTSHGGSNGCGTSNYAVTIDAEGYFHDYAWNDIVGWISFNCNNDGTCGSSDYKVKTDLSSTSLIATLESSIIDTKVVGGAKLNSIIWQGYQPAETSVDFQIASSNSSSGPWIYKGPKNLTEPEGSLTDYYGLDCANGTGVGSPYGAGPNKAICTSDIGQARYFRYKVRLRSNPLQTASPQVDDVILNWSR